MKTEAQNTSIETSLSHKDKDSDQMNTWITMVLDTCSLGEMRNRFEHGLCLYNTDVCDKKIQPLGDLDDILFEDLTEQAGEGDIIVSANGVEDQSHIEDDNIEFF